MQLEQSASFRSSVMQEKRNCKLIVEEREIIYETLQAKDLEQTISCMVNTFPEAEPMTKALGITPDEFFLFAELFCKKAVNDGLSLVAKENKTGNVVAFSIAEDFTGEPPEGIEKINDKFHPIMALLNDLDEEYKKANRVDEGEFLHLFMIGACGPYRNRRIVTTLVEKHLQLAKAKKFSGAIAEVTGPISRHIFVDKFGFDEKLKINYTSYVYNGIIVFESIKDCSSCILVEKRF